MSVNEQSSNVDEVKLESGETLREYLQRFGQQALSKMFSSLSTNNNDELQIAPTNFLQLQHPLRAEQQSCKVFFIDNDDETEIKIVRDEKYINQLKNDVTTSGILNEASEKNPRGSINEAALVELIKNASKETCPAERAIRAAQVANSYRPDFTAFQNAGEMFLQQVVYSPIADLFCAFSTYYCADKKVMCAHGVYCYENNKKVQRSVSCLPDAALQLTSSFYVIAMMELKCIGSGNPYRQDFFRCKLMTAMSLLAIAEYLVDEGKKDRDELDIAIPFIQGSFQGVELYVMRLQGRGCPKIHVISTCEFFDRDVPKHTSEKLNLLSQLAVLLARIVEVTIDHQADMEGYFCNGFDYSSTAIPRNAIGDTASANKRSSTTQVSSQNKASKGDTPSARTGKSASAEKSPSDNENAAKVAASRSGQIQELVYPFFRIRELDLGYNDKTDWRREADFNFFQQESPYFFRGVDKGQQSSSEDNAVFCKVWREGDSHTSREAVEEEIHFYRRANANNVPSPLVIDRLTALDVECMTHPDSATTSTYHVLVTQYHRNDAVDENDFLVFALSFVQAVLKLHSIGILHCDIKPGNILWDSMQKRVLLIDFEHAQEEVNSRWYTATRLYEAPEIASEKPHTRKSDTYCVGKTLESVIEKFKNPVSPKLAALVTSLIMESDSERMSLVEAERQLRDGDDDIRSPPCNDRSSCLPTKRSRETVYPLALKLL